MSSNCKDFSHDHKCAIQIICYIFDASKSYFYYKTTEHLLQVYFNCSNICYTKTSAYCLADHEMVQCVINRPTEQTLYYHY